MTQLHLDNPGQWRLEGALNFESLSAKAISILHQMPNDGPWHVNLEAVTDIDSSGIALLIGLIRHASERSIEFKLLGSNAIPKVLIDAYDVTDLISQYRA